MIWKRIWAENEWNEGSKENSERNSNSPGSPEWWSLSGKVTTVSYAVWRSYRQKLSRRSPCIQIWRELGFDRERRSERGNKVHSATRGLERILNWVHSWSPNLSTFLGWWNFSFRLSNPEIETLSISLGCKADVILLPLLLLTRISLCAISTHKDLWQPMEYLEGWLE